MRRNKVDVITLGCSKNLVDSEKLLRQFQLNGYRVMHDPEMVNGEIVVVNSCAFIGDAQEESINLLLALEEQKRKGRIGKLFVMGCLSERFFKELKQEFPEVDHFYGKFDWTHLIEDIGKSFYHDFSNDRLLTTPPHYAYLKISEGCNRTCAYCSIPIITGRYQSRKIEEILDEAKLLVAKGIKEVQLIAQDLTYYGLDRYKEARLPELVERLADIEGIEWLRLHYGYPSRFPYDLLRVIRERENVCNYMDIALQHISDPVLKMMRRNISKQETIDFIARVREEVPGIHLRTTLMVGHPGETSASFEEIIEFAKETRFERMGAFAYSHEVGTYAYKHYSDTISDEIKQERLNELMHIQERISSELNASKVNKTFRTIIDREEEEYYIGRTEFDSPDVDPEILIKKEETMALGSFYQIKIESAEPFDLYGKRVS